MICSQNRIGWTHFTRGRLSVQWIKYQERYFAIQEKNNPKSLAYEWGVQVIKGLLEIADNIWTFRCQQLHEEAGVFHDPEEKRKALDCLRALYRRQNEVSQQDRFLFARPYEDWQQSASSTIMSWCKQVKQSLRKRKIIDAKALLAAHRPIYEYFTLEDPPDAGTNAGFGLGTGAASNQIES